MPSDLTTPSRRSFVLGLGAGLGAFTLPGAARAASGKRVLIMGSSQIRGGVGRYLETALAESGHQVHRKAKSASGLARPDFFNWFAEARAQYRDFAPDLTLVMFGGNDAQGLRMGKEADPPWVRWADEGWVDEYTVRVRGLAEIVTANGEDLCWIGMPIVRPSKLRARLTRINGVYQGVMAEQPNWHFIDTWPFMAGPDGRYLEHVELRGEAVELRASDGVHMTRTGAHRFVDRVEPEVRALL